MGGEVPSNTHIVEPVALPPPGGAMETGAPTHGLLAPCSQPGTSGETGLSICYGTTPLPCCSLNNNKPDLVNPPRKSVPLRDWEPEPDWLAGRLLRPGT